MIYKTFFLALGQNGEPNLQDPYNKRRRRPSNIKKIQRGKIFRSKKERS
jgi:hypothetical protein